MRSRALGILVLCLVWANGLIGVGAQSGSAALQGAWDLRDYSYASAAPVRLNKPTGLLLFAGNHYAFVILRDSGARPQVGPEGANATAEQLRAAWGPLQAQAGTFQASGNLLTMRAAVAKSPASAAPGAFYERTFAIDGDTLVLTTTRTPAGPAQNPSTWRLTRAR
jgi:hypothetical protein